MNWLNLEIRVLRSPAYIGSDPIERATWINVLAFCCEQENGGRLAGARLWKDRQWQQLCGVTLREIVRSTKLLSWEGDDLCIVGYPHAKESEVRAKREAGREGGRKSGEARAAEKGSTASSSASPAASTEGEGEGKGREGEEERKEPAGSEPSAPARKPSGQHQQFIDDWMAYYEKRNGAPYPFTGRDAKAASQLRGHFKSSEEAKRFITAVHARTGEGYPFANAETLYDLANNIAKLQAALAQKSNGPHPPAPKPLPTSEERYGPGK